jgi:hypothetical protein
VVAQQLIIENFLLRYVRSLGTQMQTTFREKVYYATKFLLSVVISLIKTLLKMIVYGIVIIAGAEVLNFYLKLSDIPLTKLFFTLDTSSITGIHVFKVARDFVRIFTPLQTPIVIITTSIVTVFATRIIRQQLKALEERRKKQHIAHLLEESRVKLAELTENAEKYEGDLTSKGDCFVVNSTKGPHCVYPGSKGLTYLKVVKPSEARRPPAVNHAVARNDPPHNENRGDRPRQAVDPRPQQQQQPRQGVRQEAIVNPDLPLSYTAKQDGLISILSIDPKTRMQYRVGESCIIQFPKKDKTSFAYFLQTDMHVIQQAGKNIILQGPNGKKAYISKMEPTAWSSNAASGGADFFLTPVSQAMFSQLGAKPFNVALKMSGNPFVSIVGSGGAVSNITKEHGLTISYKLNTTNGHSGMPLSSNKLITGVHHSSRDGKNYGSLLVPIYRMIAQRLSKDMPDQDTKLESDAPAMNEFMFMDRWMEEEADDYFMQDEEYELDEYDNFDIDYHRDDDNSRDNRGDDNDPRTDPGPRTGRRQRLRADVSFQDYNMNITNGTTTEFVITDNDIDVSTEILRNEGTFTRYLASRRIGRYSIVSMEDFTQYLRNATTAEEADTRYEYVAVFLSKFGNSFSMEANSVTIQPALEALGVASPPLTRDQPDSLSQLEARMVLWEQAQAYFAREMRERDARDLVVQQEIDRSRQRQAVLEQRIRDLHEHEANTSNMSDKQVQVSLDIDKLKDNILKLTAENIQLRAAIKGQTKRIEDLDEDLQQLSNVQSVNSSPVQQESTVFEVVAQQVKALMNAYSGVNDDLTKLVKANNEVVAEVGNLKLMIEEVKQDPASDNESVSSDQQVNTRPQIMSLKENSGDEQTPVDKTAKKVQNLSMKTRTGQSTTLRKQMPQKKVENKARNATKQSVDRQPPSSTQERPKNFHKNSNTSRNASHNSTSGSGLPVVVKQKENRLPTSLPPTSVLECQRISNLN